LKLQNLKKIIINSGLVLGSIIFTYLILELVVFRFFMHWLPLRSYALLDPAIRIFAQSSKKGTIPKDYIALLGDSYAIGLGDWYYSVNKNLNPDYHSAHLIHHQTGRDVVHFGQAGLDNTRALVSFPASIIDYLDKTILYRIDDPDYIIVYFYEGNDLDENVKEIDNRYKPNYDFNKIYDPAYFRKYLEKEVMSNYTLHGDMEQFTFWDNFFVAKYMMALVSNFKDAMQVEETSWPLGGHGPWLNDPDTKLKSWAKDWVYAKLVGSFHQALINGEAVGLVDNLVGPSLSMTEEEVELGVYAYEQSLRFLIERFPHSKIGVIYIPSPMASYHLLSPEVRYISGMLGAKSKIYPTNMVAQRSQLTFQFIKEISQKHGVRYQDLRPLIRKATKREIIHGPIDWFHFNKKGYEVLAQGTIQLIAQFENPN